MTTAQHVEVATLVQRVMPRGRSPSQPSTTLTVPCRMRMLGWAFTACVLELPGKALKAQSH